MPIIIYLSWGLLLLFYSFFSFLPTLWSLPQSMKIWNMQIWYRLEIIEQEVLENLEHSSHSGPEQSSFFFLLDVTQWSQDCISIISWPFHCNVYVVDCTPDNTYEVKENREGGQNLPGDALARSMATRGYKKVWNEHEDLPFLASWGRWARWRIDIEQWVLHSANATPPPQCIAWGRGFRQRWVCL